MVDNRIKLLLACLLLQSFPLLRAATAANDIVIARAHVERVRADIPGRTIIVDWHGTWDHTTIQAALYAARDGDTVIVLPSAGSPDGAYLENIIFPARAITLRSINPQDPAIVSATVIDGNASGSVVRFADGTPQEAAMLGFTITNGTGMEYGTEGDYVGGGFYLSGSSPTIANNSIQGNNASRSGGAIYLYAASPTISSNVIANNTASRDGSAIYLESSSPLIAHNIITGNVAGLPPHQYHGGTLSLYLSAPTIESNFISGNTCLEFGGVLDLRYSTPRILNNTIVSNEGTGILCHYPEATITNTIVAYNSAGIDFDSGTSSHMSVLSYNCVYANAEDNYLGVADLTGSNGNISVDPLLANPAYGNVHIRPDSPCRDAGDDTVSLSSLQDIDNQPRLEGAHIDIGADETHGASWPAGPNVIVRVSTSGDDSHDGSSWNLAKRTVQAGIDAATELGGDVWVQAGTYLERICLARHVHVFGGFAGTEVSREERSWSHNVVVLDAQLSGATVTSVAVGHGLSTIDGFTITGGIGESDVAGNCGGGVYCYFSSSVIRNNTITDNHVDGHGGGVYSFGCDPQIMHNTITANSAGRSGGGVYVDHAAAMIAGNDVCSNIAGEDGGGVGCAFGFARVEGNRVSGNTATRYGGGLWGYNVTYGRIANNSLAGNKAATGGGMHLWGQFGTVTQNTIVANAANGGGGVYCTHVSVPISNSVVAHNSSGICYQGTPVLPLHNCVYGNTQYSYSGIVDPAGANGNIAAEPLFLVPPDPGPDATWGTEDDDAGDSHLLPGSPCIDTGSNAFAYGYLDLDGHSRIVDGDWDDMPVVDMGAYEFIPGDLDADGAITLLDFISWADCCNGPGGQHADDCQPADLDADGDVDLADFARFERAIAR